MLKCIFSCNQDGVIGVDNTIPWHLSEDLKFFKEQTTGNTVIMGRNTYESIGHPLPNRTNIVVSSKDIDNVTTVRSLSEALSLSDKQKDVFVIGGSRLLNEAIPISDEVIVSFVNKNDIEGDNVVKVNLSFMEFLSLKKTIPFDDFTVFIFRN